jgi:uncharacterized membrane protein HdeD (DUF308 family)
MKHTKKLKFMKQSQIPSNILLYMGLIALTFGISSVLLPEFTFKTVILSLGIIVGLSGLTALIMRLIHKSKKQFIQVISIIGSIVVMLFGLTLAIFPTTFIGIFIFILGIAIILGGITQLVLSLSFTPMKNSAKVFFGFSIIMIIAGTIIIVNPFEAITSITIFFGVVITAFGVINVFMSFWIRHETATLNKQK